jgi:mannan endo-1,4-beta-mannosidase
VNPSVKKYILSAALILSVFLSQATVIIVDDFNANTVGPGWQVQGSTFSLSIEDQALRVGYDRTSSSWQWDQFNYSFTDKPVLQQYQIRIRMKSTVGTQLAVKPSYLDGTSDWLTMNIPVSTEYSDYIFSVPSATQKTLQTIYFYFDGGSSAIKSGIIRIDEITLSTTSTALLSLAISNAEILLNSSVEGSSEGQYATGSKNVFANATDNAKLILSNPQSTQNEIDQSLSGLNDANTVFEAGRVRASAIAGLTLACAGATFETQNMYANLRQIARFNTLFGMQDATGYGVGWTGNNFRSDVEDVCGSLPAVCSYSIKDVAKGQNWDDARQRFQYIYNKGGIISLEWHMDNLYGGDFYWSTNPYPDSNVVKSILPGGINHEAFKSQLDQIALFLRNLKGAKGESIPVIFRPWHEHNGNWFWWGDPHCTIEQYQQLWQFTVQYLTVNKKAGNIVFAFSPDRFYTSSNYLQRYPGDAYIDIFGFDDYGDVTSTGGITTLLSQLRLLVQMAEQRGKIPALTETGLEGVTNPEWFTQYMLTPLKNDPVAGRIAYQAVWRNANASHHYAPYPGHPSVPDFITFYNDPRTIFIEDLPPIYGSALTINGPLNIAEKQGNTLKNLRLFPNPANGMLTIEGAGEPLQYSITDLSGKQVQTGNIKPGSAQMVALKNIPKGIFLMNLTNNRGQSTTLRFIAE